MVAKVFISSYRLTFSGNWCLLEILACQSSFFPCCWSIFIFIYFNLKKPNLWWERLHWFDILTADIFTDVLFDTMFSVWVSHTAGALGDISQCRSHFCALDFIGLFEDIHIDIWMETVSSKHQCFYCVQCFNMCMRFTCKSHNFESEVKQRIGIAWFLGVAYLWTFS